MNENIYRKRFKEKVTKEFNDFKSEQLKLSKEAIFENAFKISCYYEIFSAYLIDENLNIDDIKKLLKEKCPIQTLYNYYLKTDLENINEIYDYLRAKGKDYQER